MKDTREIADADYAKQYTDWHVKTGGFARDKTLRDEFAEMAMQAAITGCATKGEVALYSDWAGFAYEMADAMLKERAK